MLGKQEALPLRMLTLSEGVYPDSSSRLCDVVVSKYVGLGWGGYGVRVQLATQGDRLYATRSVQCMLYVCVSVVELSRG